MWTVLWNIKSEITATPYLQIQYETKTRAAAFITCVNEKGIHVTGGIKMPVSGG